MKRSIVAALASAALISVVTLPAMASSDKPVIALTNAYYGNTWRHQMVEAFEASAKEAKAAGQIADYIVMNGDGSVAQQNSQIAELILKKVDVLAVDAASETAVNGVIEKACKAGIIVVSFDSVASAPCNYQLNFDFKGYKATQAEAVFKMLGGKGNVIQVRGVKGSAPDNDMFNAQQSVLAKYPDIKVAATVYGQATASVAQAAIANVLPSLPHVDAVLGQGGSDDVGIAQAFVQYGGEYKDKMPIIEGGGGTDFVKWWADENAKNGYQTVSMNTTPGIGGAAFWLGLSLLKGAKAPKMMIMPVATVDASNLKEYAKLPAGQIISPSYSLDWVKQNLLSK
ncbi:sugar ABC transporter substrate-binding protein [Mesorhizobium sp. WSM4312]|uniref:ABC transporter substrate-binding protein n=1 Tax=Mesorhizobium sp. WSM4312 TaxID=2029411 RepID=UPI000BB07E5D|nr:ABC transporter substrate-binding protein [Mesorhizobium sp. WSM4312]PBB64516.1 sugar ABC transporter substrate-binding protein [Mesorhizobium sp. WSM4312]